MLPSDRTIVVERFRDEIGDWRLCILSPFGGRVHAPWALALGALLRERLGAETQALWSDDGIVLHLPDADEPPSADLIAIDPEAIEELVVRELGGSALYGARFRENAARALLIPRRRPGQRTPLWQQRLKAQSLLQVAEGYGSFPIVLETYRECLQDVFDLPALRDLLSGIERREIALVEAETPYGSPFASSLLFDYIAQYMYEGDTPPAERRAQALSLDRELLRELLGSDELRELLDPDALAEVEALIRRRPGPGPDGLHDWLRRVGDLSAAEIGDDAGVDRAGAPAARGAAAHRRRGAPDRGRGRRAATATPSARCRRRACPTPTWSRSPTPCAASSPATPARTGRSTPRSPRRGSACRCSACSTSCAILEVDGHRRPRRDAARAGRARSGATPTCCGASGAHRWPACGAEVEAVPGETLARFLPRWQGVDDGARGGPDRLRDVLVQLQGVPLPAAILEPAVLARRVTGYRPELLDGALRRRRGRLVRRRRRPRRPRTSATTRRCSARRPARSRPEGELATPAARARGAGRRVLRRPRHGRGRAGQRGGGDALAAGAGPAR